MTVDPVTAWSIAKTAAEISKKLFALGKRVKDHEIKQQLDEIADEVRELKQTASELEDQNRELREKLHFKGDDFEFRTPFWYEKAHPDQALCPKCFAKNIRGQMGQPGQGGVNSSWRQCLVCDHAIEISPAPSAPSAQRRVPPRFGRWS